VLLLFGTALLYMVSKTQSPERYFGNTQNFGFLKPTESPLFITASSMQTGVLSSPTCVVLAERMRNWPLAPSRAFRLPTRGSPSQHVSSLAPNVMALHRYTPFVGCCRCVSCPGAAWGLCTFISPHGILTSTARAWGSSFFSKAPP